MKLTTSLLLALMTVHTGSAHAQRIDINAVGNAANHPIVETYDQGTYMVVPISPAQGGIYTAWSAHLSASNSFLHRYSISSTEFAYQEPGGTTGYQPSFEVAYLGAVSTTFTIVNQAPVSFYVCDGPSCYVYASDNTGGISLLVDQVQGTRYCVSQPNSSGTSAVVSVLGSDVANDRDLTLVTEGVIPGAFAIYFFGPTQVQQPFGDGFRCVGGAVTRIGPPIVADTRGLVLKTMEPQFFDTAITAGKTLNFQLWYRDRATSGSFNLSDAVNVTFQ